MCLTLRIVAGVVGFVAVAGFATLSSVVIVVVVVIVVPNVVVAVVVGVVVVEVVEVALRECTRIWSGMRASCARLRSRRRTQRRKSSHWKSVVLSNCCRTPVGMTVA